MMQEKRRVVVTGLGVVTPLGISLEANWDSLLEGRSGVGALTHPNAKKSPVQAVGEVPSQDFLAMRKRFPEDAEGEPRTLFALQAVHAALTDAGLPSNTAELDRAGVCLAAGLGTSRLEDIHRWMNIDCRFDYARFSREVDQVRRDSILRNSVHVAAGRIARRFGIHGCNSTITTACASATQALGLGYRTIQRGDADLIIAGGSDSMINPIGLVFFVLLRAACVSSGAPSSLCRPFDRKRSGLVMGEGAGIAVLEEESHARERGARIYAEVCGYGSSMDAYRVTAPDPGGGGAEAAMRRALLDAEIPFGDIDYINAHGTSTKLNDTAETLAIKNLFGERAKDIAVSSSKSMISHLLAGAGGPEFVYTVMSVKHDAIHPTINLNNPDPACDLDYVANKKRLKTVKAAISNSFGFGGQNASIIVRKYEA